MPFSRENLPNLGIEPASLTSPAIAGRFFTISTTREAHLIVAKAIIYRSLGQMYLLVLEGFLER